MTASDEEFLAKVWNPVLWVAGAGGLECTHGEWITRLTGAFIDSGAVTDEILLLLGPVCAVKVHPFDCTHFGNGH